MVWLVYDDSILTNTWVSEPEEMVRKVSSQHWYAVYFVKVYKCAEKKSQNSMAC